MTIFDDFCQISRLLLSDVVIDAIIVAIVVVVVVIIVVIFVVVVIDIAIVVVVVVVTWSCFCFADEHRRPASPWPAV